MKDSEALHGIGHLAPTSERHFRVGGQGHAAAEIPGEPVLVRAEVHAEVRIADGARGIVGTAVGAKWP